MIGAKRTSSQVDLFLGESVSYIIGKGEKGELIRKKSDSTERKMAMILSRTTAAGRFFILIAALCLGIGSLSAAEPMSVNLWPDGAPVDLAGTVEKVPVNLYPMLPSTTDFAAGKIPAVIICPGGGYGGLCIEPEGFGIARWLNNNGMAGFVLEYRLPKTRHMVPLYDAQRAIRYVRAHAEQYGVDPNKIGIIGFSAGGHLASAAATLFDTGRASESDFVERTSCRPDFAVLIYPVIQMGEAFTHEGTQTNLLGTNPAAGMYDYYSTEKRVTAATPPTFLAHALDDKVVPIENSRVFVRAMDQYGAPALLLELADGGHGLNGYKGRSWDKWQTEAAAWIGDL